MPAEIITQTCPAPECNLLPGDVAQFVEELAAYFDLFEPAFRWPEQAKWSECSLAETGRGEGFAPLGQFISQ